MSGVSWMWFPTLLMAGLGALLVGSFLDKINKRIFNGANFYCTSLGIFA